MPETTTQTSAQAPTPPGSDTGGGPDLQQAAGAADGGARDVATLQRDLADARKEASKHRAEAKRLTDERKAATDAQLSETERLARRVAELEAEREELQGRDRERALRFAAVDAAARLGFRDPELAVRLIDRDAVEVRDDGTPKNVERLLAEVLAKAPYLGRSGGTADFGGGIRGSVPPGSDMNSLIRRAAGRI